MDKVIKKHIGDGYWEPRSGCLYYQKVREWLNQYTPGGSLMDVGGHDTPVAAWGDFDDRTIVTKGEVVNRLPHVQYHITDFMDFDPKRNFHVVTCLQVMEHLDNDTVEKFAKKLCEHSVLATIVSVPFMWEKGRCKSHLQDPVDLKKLSSWFGREPNEYVIVQDKHLKRIVARYIK